MDTQLYRGINVKALLVRTLKDIWQTQFFYRCAIKPKPLAKWCKMVHNNSTSCHFSPGKRRLFTPISPVSE